MKLETSITESYIRSDDIYYNKSNWIFSRVVEGEILFEEVPINKVDQIKHALKLACEIIDEFAPVNHKIWNQLYGEFNWDNIDVTIHFIVGLPEPYDALVRTDLHGNQIIVIDLNRVLGYAEDDASLRSVLQNFLTHEMAHIMNQQFLSLDNKSNKLEILKYVFIDEGIAHYVAYTSEVMGASIEDALRLKKFEYSGAKMEYYLCHPDEITQEILIESCSGKFWEKFACIEGMRCVHEKLCNSELMRFGGDKSVNDIFEELYEPK